MKRKNLFFIAALSCVFLFCSCAHTHNWKNASCFNPRTCIGCGLTEGDPLGHNWVEATCEDPKYCSACGMTEGINLEHNWTAGTSTIPSECINCGKMKPLELPKSGQVFIGSSLYRNSELSIKSSTGDSSYIKLKSTSGEDVFSFFVQAGDSVTVPVPAGYYYVYFSYGKDWYGTEHIFGPDTTYAKDDEILDFENYTWEYTLYPTQGGNFSETPIDAEEF